MQTHEMTMALIGTWRGKLHDAVAETERANRRWRTRQQEVKTLTSKLAEANRRSWIAQDIELAEAMADYGFWQREVLRLAAQIQAECMAERLIHDMLESVRE